MNELDFGPSEDERRGQPPPSRPAAAPAVLTVTRLLASVRLLVERQMGLVWVGGEISGCNRAASGHLYFTLKDANAQVRCVLYRNKAQGLPFVLRDGLA